MKRRLAVSLGVFLGVTLAAWLAVPRILPAALAHYRPDIAFSVPTGRKTLYLTIDDAPSTHTGEILAVLKKHRVSATFFIIGNRVTEPSALARIVAEGHALGNHLQGTQACSKLSLPEFSAAFDATALQLQPHYKAKLFRPPSDFGTREQMTYAGQHDGLPVMGTVFPLDHWIHAPNQLVRVAQWLAVDGGIVILHDGNERGAVTARVLDRLLPILQAEGYAFGSLEQDLISLQ